MPLRLIFSAIPLIMQTLLVGGIQVGAAGIDTIVSDFQISQSFAIRTENWSGDRAMADIATQLRFTPRSLDTIGHEKTIDFIQTELAKSSVKAIKAQRWNYVDKDGNEHKLTNIIARFDLSNPHRIIVGTHYDSIVRAYQDPRTPNAAMPGANNSASGVAVLLETARALSVLKDPPLGVDLVFFDGEEGPKSLGAGDPKWYPLGSPYFAAHLTDIYPKLKPEKAIVFDMVCFNKLKLHPEVSSIKSASTEVTKFWDIGQKLSPSVFMREPTDFAINDDHTALTEAKIPSFLVIDFDYEPWFNTTKDTIENCSPTSLEIVGRTLMIYLFSQ